MPEKPKDDPVHPWPPDPTGNPTPTPPPPQPATKGRPKGDLIRIGLQTWTQAEWNALPADEQERLRALDLEHHRIATDYQKGQGKPQK
jgi:hypothetical protein